MYMNKKHPFINTQIGAINESKVKSVMNRGTIPIDEQAVYGHAKEIKEKMSLVQFEDPIQIRSDGDIRRIDDTIYPSICMNYMNALEDYAVRYDIWRRNTSPYNTNESDIIRMQKFHKFATNMNLTNIDYMYMSRIRNAIYTYFYQAKEMTELMLQNYDYRNNCVICSTKDMITYFIEPVIREMESAFCSIRFQDIRYQDMGNFHSFDDVILFTISSTLTKLVNVIYDTILRNMVMPTVFGYQGADTAIGEESISAINSKNNTVYNSICTALSRALITRYDTLAFEIHEVLEAVKNHAYKIKNEKPDLVEIIPDTNEDEISQW